MSNRTPGFCSETNLLLCINTHLLLASGHLLRIADIIAFSAVERGIQLCNSQFNAV